MKRAICLWKVPLPPVGSVDAIRLCATYAATLDESERQRASRYRVDEARLRFVLMRGALRSILAMYLANSPKDVPLAVGRFGKPALSRNGSTKLAMVETELPGLEFNVSHTAELGVIAISPGKAVGVDVELVAPIANRDAFAKVVLHGDEAVQYREIRDDSSSLQFLLMRWVAKESIAKGIGHGITLGEQLNAWKLRLSEKREAEWLVQCGNFAEPLGSFFLDRDGSLDGWRGAWFRMGERHISAVAWQSDASESMTMELKEFEHAS